MAIVKTPSFNSVLDLPVIEYFVDIKLSEKEYKSIKGFLYSETGIDLGDHKQQLVSGRLCKRLRHHNIASYKDYFDLVLEVDQLEERQQLIDLLTTNETYFFREKKHFDYLRDQILPLHPKGKKFQIWSAASSSGEEAYSLAMELAGKIGCLPGCDEWEVMGSDISTEVIIKAQKALYPMKRTEGIPKHYLKEYCLRGKGEYEGHFLIDPRLAERVKFRKINLTQPLSKAILFDVIFLRNVLIYFDRETKLSVLRNVSTALKENGHLMIGHSESICAADLDDILRSKVNSIYQKI